MNEEELYKLAISDVPKYSLLNEILAIRDNRFPNEKVDYCINVNGYISLDVLNKYVRNINELEQLQKQNAELIKTKNKALSYIRIYNHLSLRYQDAEAKDRLNFIKNILNDREDYQDKLQNNWNELNKFIEEEKNRLATQVSNTYEDSLGERRFVNEDIFNELTKVSEKMQELGNDKEC